MKNIVKRVLQASAFTILTLSFNTQAGLWQDTKETAANVWEKTKNASSQAWDAAKETSTDIKKGAQESWKEATAEKPEPSMQSKEDTGSLSDVKKLGDTETYIKAWEGIKESARNPSAPASDEHALPKQ